MKPLLFILSDWSTFQDVQREFTEKFPFLKMVFLPSRNSVLKPAYINEQIWPGEFVKRFVRNGKTRQWFVNDDMTVTQIVKTIEDILDVSVVIFRRSANVWIETSLTRNWTVEQQNREGEQITSLGS